MGKISVAKLVPGMILEADVYNYNDQLVLPEGLELNEKAIDKLKYYSITSVRVREDVGFASEASDDSYSKKVKESAEYKVYKASFEKTVGEMSRMISDVVLKNAPLDTVKLVGDALELLHPKSGEVNVFDMVHNMRHYDDITFAHSLNVGLICNVFAGWLGFTPHEQRIALECGMLHDIGKLKIPEPIINKPQKLTDAEFNVVKTHPTEGYKILQKYDVNEHVKSAALMHHERCDGSGYPLGLVSKQIDPFAKIVAIADVYEAMTSTRNYRGSLCPFEVIAAFEEEGLQKYDTRMIMTFLENIVNTYMLNRVGLSNGKEGEIVFINRTRLSKPMVKCGDEYIDLSQNPSIKIVKII